MFEFKIEEDDPQDQFSNQTRGVWLITAFENMSILNVGMFHEHL